MNQTIFNVLAFFAFILTCLIIGAIFGPIGLFIFGAVIVGLIFLFLLCVFIVQLKMDIDLTKDLKQTPKYKR